jgi:hypothetical protein
VEDCGQDEYEDDGFLVQDEDDLHDEDEELIVHNCSSKIAHMILPPPLVLQPATSVPVVASTTSSMPVVKRGRGRPKGLVNCMTSLFYYFILMMITCFYIIIGSANVLNNSLPIIIMERRRRYCARTCFACKYFTSRRSSNWGSIFSREQFFTHSNEVKKRHRCQCFVHSRELLETVLHQKVFYYSTGIGIRDKNKYP